ncbi:MAG: sialidase family protein [Thermoproteota archaeon]
MASTDGAVSWCFLSYVTPEDSHPPKICPHPAVLPDGRIITALRTVWPDWRLHWTETYVSEDGGLTWRFQSRVNDWGAPAALQTLKDGRLLCTYGYRVPPYGVRARISGDGGETWGGR